MLYDYTDFVTSLSQKQRTVGRSISAGNRREILDEDHYGLKKVKERIIQQLAVMALNKKQSGSILLFVVLQVPVKPVSVRVSQGHCTGNM